MLKSSLSQKKEVALHVSVRQTLKVLNNDMVDEFIQYFEDTCRKTPSTQPYLKKTCSLELTTNYHRSIQHRRLTLEFQVNVLWRPSVF